MKKKIAVLFLVFSMVFISCDQDFNTIGADLVGDEHFDFDAYSVQNIKAYSVSTGEVQTNNLPINPLGFYNNPYFGETKANFVTQAALTVLQPDFGTNVRIENVTLYVPYFSTSLGTDGNGETTYVLDSIYGANKESKMKLSVYENGYFLNNLDPSSNFEDEQRYYSNSTSNSNSIDFDGLKIGHDNSGNIGTERLNDSSDPSENDQFYFNKEEIVVYKRKLNSFGDFMYVDANDEFIVPQNDVSQRVVLGRLAPGIFITLNREYFKKRILEASSNDLYTNNDFRQYFKGLYFKMEQIAGEEGAMAMLNFNNASINVNYSSLNTGEAVATSKSLVMSLGVNANGNTVSLQDFTPSSGYSTSLAANLNQTTGQNDKLFVKGGKGAVVYMDLFGDTDVLKVVDGQLVSGSNSVPDELDQLRVNKWLINDAYLEVYVDKDAMLGNSKSQEPERLYLFDATNQKPLVDYSFDTSVSANSKRSKAIFGGIVERDASGKAVKYKIRIMQHINNILNSTNFNVNKNIKLGLCVIENIGLVSNYFYKVPQAFVIGPEIKIFPVSSITAQQGVVLHGTGSADVAKRLKLTIHYTKPN